MPGIKSKRVVFTFDDHSLKTLDESDVSALQLVLDDGTVIHIHARREGLLIRATDEVLIRPSDKYAFVMSVERPAT